MINNDLPKLLTGIEIVDNPVAQSIGIGGKDRRRCIKGVGAGKVVIEQMRISIQKKKMCVAVIEGIVALVIYLGLGALTGIDGRRVTEGLDRRWRGICLSLVRQMKPGRSGCVAIPRILDVKSLRAILREVEVIEKGECIPAAEVSAEWRRGVVGQQIRRDSRGAQVVVSIHWKEQFAAKDGSAGFI